MIICAHPIADNLPMYSLLLFLDEFEHIHMHITYTSTHAHTHNYAQALAHLQTPIQVDPLCDMFLPLTPERKRNDIYKDIGSFYSGAPTERRYMHNNITCMYACMYVRM